MASWLHSEMHEKIIFCDSEVKLFKESMKLNWNFQRGGVKPKKNVCGGVCIFPGTIHIYKPRSVSILWYTTSIIKLWGYQEIQVLIKCKEFIEFEQFKGVALTASLMNINHYLNCYFNKLLHVRK